jgi:hypothetical protein
MGATHVVVGLGRDTCADFTKSFNVNPETTLLKYFTWAQGYMSGMNFYLAKSEGHARELESMPERDQQAFLWNYCVEHPSDIYGQGVVELMFKLNRI